MTIRSPRTYEELLRLHYKPLRKGLRTNKQVFDLYVVTKTPEFIVVKTNEPPFERIVFKGNTYSNQGEKMQQWTKDFDSLGITNDSPSVHCEQLKKRKRQWEAENI